MTVRPRFAPSKRQMCLARQLTLLSIGMATKMAVDDGARATKTSPEKEAASA